MGEVILALVIIKGVEGGLSKSPILCLETQYMFYKPLWRSEKFLFVENVQSLNEEVKNHDVCGFHPHELLTLQLESIQIVEFSFGEGLVRLDNDGVGGIIRLHQI